MNAHVLDRVASAVARVPDPELPTLTIADLGILRGVAAEGECIVVRLTPTYSGCPAIETIENGVRAALDDCGVEDFELRTEFAPPWTTDWISAEGREKMRAQGIAPPGVRAATQPIRWSPRAPESSEPIACPQCESKHTERIAAFSSTACKALYRCLACREAFEFFKPI